MYTDLHTPDRGREQQRMATSALSAAAHSHVPVCRLAAASAKVLARHYEDASHRKVCDSTPSFCQTSSGLAENTAGQGGSSEMRN